MWKDCAEFAAQNVKREGGGETEKKETVKRKAAKMSDFNHTMSRTQSKPTNTFVLQDCNPKRQALRPASCTLSSNGPTGYVRLYALRSRRQVRAEQKTR